MEARGSEGALSSTTTSTKSFTKAKAAAPGDQPMQPSHLSQSEALHSDLKAITEAHRAQVHLHTVHSPRHVAPRASSQVAAAAFTRLERVSPPWAVHDASSSPLRKKKAAAQIEESGLRGGPAAKEASEPKSRPNSWATKSSGSSSTWTFTMAS